MDLSSTIKFFIVILTSVMGFGYFSSDPVFGIEYQIYSNEKFKISFQYPTDWNVKEPTSRFDDQVISIGSKNSLSGGQFNIFTYDKVIEMTGSTNIQETAEGLLNALTSSVTRYEKVIEKVSSMKIDGQDTRTFITSSKDKLDQNSIPIGTQVWIVFTAKNTGYMITYFQSTESFDNPEFVEIRDHFIESIKFLT